MLSRAPRTRSTRLKGGRSIRRRKAHGMTADEYHHAIRTGQTKATLMTAVIAYRLYTPSLIPQLMFGSPSTKGGIWCAYHQEDTHNTKDYCTIPKELEKLYHVSKILHAQAATEEAERQATTKKREYKQINTITGGKRITFWLSNRNQKNQASANDACLAASVQYDCEAKMPRERWAPIVFEEEEGRSVRTPHGDPLVISVFHVKKFNIQRVFIDNGSAVNIIYLH